MTEPPVEEPEPLIEASFRKETSRLLASLTRAFGPSYFTIAEDVVQETFHRALILWPIHGTPPNPSAWLHRVARNLAVDTIRRERIYADETALASIEVRDDNEEFFDDELKLLFLCCHPKLSIESQIALTLKSLCGLGIREISKALLAPEVNIAQRIVRAKRALEGATFELPDGERLQSRLNVVLRTLYLLFNEGYARQSGPHLTDPELCDEAILLTARLVNTAIGATPQTHALLALMLLHSSRIPARIDNDGSLCLLEDQDRSRWDRARIRAGLSHLALSASGSNMTPYHCEAAIASCHAIAPGFQESDWSAILSHYDDLARMGAGPIAELNRAVALSMVHGPERGLEALSKIAAHPKLRTYYLLPATQARFLERLGRFCEARDQYLRAYELATNSAERHFLAQRLSAVLGQERNCLIIGE